MDAQITDLIALQKIDSSIQQEESRIASVPIAIAKLGAQIQEKQQRLDTDRQRLDKSQKERRRLEGELETLQGKGSKYQDQLMEVKSNEAYRAMLKEIEGVNKEVESHEERILEHMIGSDELVSEIEELEKGFDQERVALEAQKSEKEREGKEAEERLEGLRHERKHLATNLGAEVLGQYEKVARQRGGLGIVPVKDELCLGCRVKVRPQVFQEIRLGEGLRICETCGRYLYYDETLENAPEPQPAPAADATPAPGPTEPTR